MPSPSLKYLEMVDRLCRAQSAIAHEMLMQAHVRPESMTELGRARHAIDDYVATIERRHEKACESLLDAYFPKSHETR